MGHRDAALAVTRVVIFADGAVKASFSDNHSIAISPDAEAFELYDDNETLESRHLSSACTSEHSVRLGIALRLRNAFFDTPVQFPVLNQGPFAPPLFCLGYPLRHAEFPRSIQDAVGEGLLSAESADRGARVTTRDGYVTFFLHPSRLLARATFPASIPRCSGDAPLKYRHAWTTVEFPSTATPDWLLPALALCVLGLRGASPGREGGGEETCETVTAVRGCLEAWAPQYLRTAPRFVPIPRCRGQSREANGRAGALSRWEGWAGGEAEASAGDGGRVGGGERARWGEKVGEGGEGSAWGAETRGPSAWWRSVATYGWPRGGARVAAEWVPGMTSMPVWQGDDGEVECVGVSHGDGALLVTGGGGRAVHLLLSGGSSRVFLADRLPERVHVGAPVLGGGLAVGAGDAFVGGAAVLGAATGASRGAVPLGAMASRLLSLRRAVQEAVSGGAVAVPCRSPLGAPPASTARAGGEAGGGVAGWAGRSEGDRYEEALRFAGGIRSHPAPGRKVAYHRPGGGPIGYPVPELEDRGARSASGRGGGYFDKVGSYRARYDRAADEWVVEEATDPDTGRFVAHSDGTVHVRFVDGTVLHMAPDGELSRVVWAHGQGATVVTSRRPLGAGAYVAAALEFRAWAFRSADERAVANEELRRVRVELSRIERHVAMLRWGRNAT